MKKNIIRLVALVFIVSLVLSLCSCAEKTDTKLQYKITEEGTVEITSYSDSTTTTEIEIPDEIEGKPVTKVCDFGVFNAESLKTIKIGKNVKEIGAWAFTNNQGLEKYEVSSENQYFTAVDGVLFTKDMKTLIFYPPARNIKFDKYKQSQNTTTYVIPDGVETVRSKAFYKCYYVTSIKIPDSVKRIEEKAFHRTTALESLKLPSSLEFIGKDAFAYCAKVTEVTVPAGVKEIDEYAFYNCTELKEVNMLCKESEMTLGKKWYPTDNGKEIKELVINWE